MKTEKQYKSDAFEAIHEMMEDLYQIDAIDKKTMRDFDEACLRPTDQISGKTIKELRTRENVSQPVFAAYLNVSSNLISDWERGIKKPGGPALRLLTVIEKHGLESLR